MKIILLSAFCISGGVLFADNVNLKAQHAIGASSTIFAVQTTKNTSTKGNMLSVVKKSSGAITFSAPTIELNRQLVSPADSMVASSAISAGATGVVSYAAQSLSFIGSSGTSDYKVDGTPDVGAGGAAAVIEVACLDPDPNTGDWVVADTITDESFHDAMGYAAVITCIIDYGGSPTFRAVRGSVKSNLLGYPW